mmetsp:Transcript_81953/g.187577  ORF Transcript_81953/g.187577 Transcript_81953/m.187577 type:complete len:418 (-) Transcript_81953:662-1915(-)
MPQPLLGRAWSQPDTEQEELPSRSGARGCPGVPPRQGPGARVLARLWAWGAGLRGAAASRARLVAAGYGTGRADQNGPSTWGLQPYAGLCLGFGRNWASKQTASVTLSRCFMFGMCRNSLVLLSYRKHLLSISSVTSGGLGYTEKTRTNLPPLPGARGAPSSAARCAISVLDHAYKARKSCRHPSGSLNTIRNLSNISHSTSKAKSTRSRMDRSRTPSPASTLSTRALRTRRRLEVGAKCPRLPRGGSWGGSGVRRARPGFDLALLAARSARSGAAAASPFRPSAGGSCFVGSADAARSAESACCRLFRAFRSASSCRRLSNNRCSRCLAASTTSSAGSSTTTMQPPLPRCHSASCPAACGAFGVPWSSQSFGLRGSSSLGPRAAAGVPTALRPGASSPLRPVDGRGGGGGGPAGPR